jgi:hypothetical protein
MKVKPSPNSWFWAFWLSFFFFFSIMHLPCYSSYSSLIRNPRATASSCMQKNCQSLGLIRLKTMLIGAGQRLKKQGK